MTPEPHLGDYCAHNGTVYVVCFVNRERELARLVPLADYRKGVFTRQTDLIPWRDLVHGEEPTE